MGIPSALALSRKHPRELYLLWYIFSFFFLLFLALNLIAMLKGQELNDLLGQFAFVYGYLTNDQDELLLVTAVVYLGIGPQLLSYLLSGPFGCATSPLFIRQIQAVAILSLAKFGMGLSGITLAAALASLFFCKPVAKESLSLGIAALGGGLVFAASHFSGFEWLRIVFEFERRCIQWLSELLGLPHKASAHNSFRITLVRIVRRFLVPRLRSVHRFFTRHSKPAEPEPAQHAELELAPGQV
jgi:hypothetical protein